MQQSTGTTDPLIFTDVAVAKVKELLSKLGGNSKLRIFVTGLGCSGAQFGFTFDEAQTADDTVFKVAGVPLVVDSLTYPYLVDAEVDYTVGPEYSDFVIRAGKPPSARGCSSAGGCGESSCG